MHNIFKLTELDKKRKKNVKIIFHYFCDVDEYLLLHNGFDFLVKFELYFFFIHFHDSDYHKI